MVTLRSCRATSKRASGTAARASGFTLIELIIVMTIMLVLMGMAIPLYLRYVRAAKEAVLHEDLYTIRKAIDSYTVDKSRAPQSLQDLVDSGYLKSMPKDPITARTDTWQVTMSDNLNSVDQTQPGIDDVHSGAQEVSLEGSSYNTW
jgi:general secretion pathway protein G